MYKISDTYLKYNQNITHHNHNFFLLTRYPPRATAETNPSSIVGPN